MRKTKLWALALILSICAAMPARGDDALVKGWLAFNLIHGTSIYTNVVRLDGSEQRTVHAADGLIDTSLSADGQHLIGSRIGAHSTVVTVGLDGRPARPICTIEGYVFSPTWSPDMRQVAFCLSRAGKPRIYVMTGEGKDVRPISDEGAMSPHWSSDGKKIAYVKFVPDGGRGEIKLSDLRNGATATLLQADYPITDIAWAPGDRRLAYTLGLEGATQIFLINADGTNPTPITQTPGARTGLRFSEDGHTLYYSRAEKGGRQSTLMSLVPGGEEQEIMRAAAGDLIMMNGGLLMFWAETRKK